MLSYRSLRPVLGLMLVLFSVSFIAVSDSWADDCLDCSTSPPPVTPVNASCPALDEAHPDPLLAINPRAESTAKVGKIADAFSVSSTGEAVYHLTLEVPPGRAGMEPHPSLTYDSGAGSGLVGMGFSLGGFSSITRCASNVAQDGRIRGVSYDKGDNFCLDGLRLVKVTHFEAAVTGQCFDEYRTFPDTFRSVRAYCAARGDEDKGPAWFQVLTKPGRILDYGNDRVGPPNGRLMGEDGVIRAWWITQEQDRRSNAIQYLYRNETDPVDGHTVTHVPARINYTAYLGSPAKAATNAVVFDAPDVAIDLNAYVGGMLVSRRPRLDKIRMLGLNDAPVRSYQLVWDANALPGRSRISQIVECAEDNSSKCRPPTRLSWLDQPQQGFERGVDTGIAYPVGPYADIRFKWMMADVTGDGLGDLVTTQVRDGDWSLVDWKVARNLGGNLDSLATWYTSGTPSLPPPANNIGGLTEAEMTFDVVPHDYDQDGIGDLLFSDPAGGEITWMRSLPQGGAFKGLGTGVFIPKPIPANHRVTASTALYADVDGDGVADVIQCNELAAPQGGSHGDWFVRRWSPGGNGAPAGFGAPENIAWLNQRGCNLRRYMHLVDLDGDGKTEIVFPPFGYTREEAQPQSTPQCVGACVYSSLQWYQPAGGGAPDWSLTDTGLPAPDWSIAGGSSRVLFLDVNGDGLPDAVSGGNWLFPGQLVTSINTGKGFQFGLPSLAGYSSDQTEYINFSATLDFDGDGRMDLLLPMKSGACLPYSGKLSCWVVLKSRPSGFGAFDFIPVNIPFSDEIDHTVTRLQQKLIPRVTDVNGDGRADVVMPIDGTFQVFVNDGPRDLLQTVTDGMNPLDPGDDGFLPDVAIEYGTVLDHAKTVGIDPTSSDAESETYLPRTDQLNGCDYPRTCVVGSKRVVSSYTLNNGQNQARAFSMRYRDGRAHRLGRGFLGFGTVMTIDDELNAGRADVYDNVTHDLTFNTFPFAGSLVHSWSWVPEVAGPWNKIAFSYTDWTLVSALSTGQAGAPWTYFTLPVETRTRKSEDLFLSANGTSTMLAFVADHAANPMGDLLDTSEVVSGYDSYGNIMVQQRTTANVDDVRTVERHPYNDANNWLLGEVTKEVACSTALGDTKCRTTVRTYNARGEVETEGRGDPANPETTRNTTFARDDFGNLILVTADDAFGNHRSACITYEKEGIFPYAFSRAVGQISHVAFDAGLGVPTALKDANGLTTVWQHDAFGRTTRETGADGVVTDLGLQRLKNGGPAHTWYAIYPDTTIAGAFRHGQELDSRGRTVRSWAYGPHVAAQNGMNQSTHPLYEEDTTYDLLGRVAQRSKPWMIGDPVGSQLYTQYEYDTLGRTLSVKSPWGYKTRYDYSGNTVVTTMPAAGTMLATSSTTEVDPLGRPITVTDAKLGTTATTYGPFGEPSVVASPAGLFVTVRDAYGRVTQEIDPDRGTTQIHYNGFDEQSQIVDAANRVVAYTYDSLGRRTRRRDNGALSTTWHYDDPVKGYGRLADVTSVGGPTKSYTYDPKGRVSSVALLLSGETFTSQYHHDASGNVDTIDYPQGPGGAQFRVRNEYDEDDNLTGVRDDIDPNHPYFWRLTRVNGVGQTSQEIFGNNAVNQGHALVTERDYFTDTGALKAIRTTAGSTLVQDLAYSYDARLNLATRTDALQLGVNAPKTERFAYDELDRLTSSNLNIVCSPAGSCNDSQVLTYAADGNIATKSDVAGGAKYAYDVANLHPHAVASIGALAYGYDTVGNQTSRPGLTIDYTPFDLPKRYTPTSGDPTPTTFDYDGDQTRVRKTSPGDETVYAGGYERVTHFGMQAEPTEHRYYISSNERVVAVVTRTSQDTKTAYLHVDHLGSTDVVTDGGAGLVFGTVREWRSYDAFGAKRNPIWGVQAPGGSPALTSLGFTSHESEGELGLVNMKGRMFDPKVGRFLSTDPLVSHPGFSQSWNPYSYVLNNPLKFVDPSGFDGDLPGGQIEIVNQRDPIPGVVTETSTTTGPGGIWVTPPGGGTGVTGTGTPPPPGGGVPPGAVTPPPQGDADTPPGDPSPPLDEPANERVVKNIVPDSGGLLNKIAVGAAAGAASFIAGAAAIAPVVKPILDAAAQVLEHGLGPGAAAADRGFPHIGGEPWKAFEPGSSACQTGCEDVARLIQQAIGGDQKVIKGPGRYLGRVMNSAGKFVNPAGDRALGWNFHQVVVKDGKVYDALTGPNGLATSLYKQLWEFGDVLDFGF